MTIIILLLLMAGDNDYCNDVYIVIHNTYVTYIYIYTHIHIIHKSSNNKDVSNDDGTIDGTVTTVVLVLSPSRLVVSCVAT